MSLRPLGSFDWLAFLLLLEQLLEGILILVFKLARFYLFMLARTIQCFVPRKSFERDGLL